MVTVELNQEALARAARMSTDILAHAPRFRNLDAFQQYPPQRFNNNNNATNNNKHFVKEVSINENVVVAGPASSPDVISSYPVPDYTPPMARTANGVRNQRYQ